MKGKKHHAKRASGGRTEMKVSGNPDVFKEADERKKGGRVKKHVMADHGEKARKRMDRPGRKRGGRVGADRSPLSSAHNSSGAESSPKTQEGGASD